MSTFPNQALIGLGFSRKKGLRRIGLRSNYLGNNFEPAKHLMFGRTGRRMKIWDGSEWKLPAWANDAVAIKSADYTLTQDDRQVVFTATATCTIPPLTFIGHTVRLICRAGILTLSSSGTIKGSSLEYLYAGEDLIVSNTESGVWE